MPRSGAAARRRLQQAAFELCTEQGYDATTAAQIAARAGVTERTFFRHFPDKREAFFGSEAELTDVIVAAITATPPRLGPLAALLAGFLAAAPLVEANREILPARAALIAAVPALRERQLTKNESLTRAIAGALAARGLTDSTALMAAQVGMAAFERASREWGRDQPGSLSRLVAESFEAVRELT